MKLNPCPFCADDKTVFVTDEDNTYRVFCGRCFALGPSAGTDANAREYWNERLTNEQHDKHERDTKIP